MVIMSDNRAKLGLPCLGGGDQSEEEARVIAVNQGQLHKHYKGNYASTTKYNIFTFLPKSLFEQYRRAANLYFTAVAALSTTPYSPVRAWTTFLPLVVVLGVAMGKEGVEDYKRYKADREVNNRKIRVLNLATGNFEDKFWKDVKVGDIVEVLKDEYFPADLVFLSAENEEGICYIETMNLDGETNLKIKKALDETKDYNRSTLKNFKADVKCEGPNPRLYTFTGNLEITPDDGSEPKKLSLSPAAILLRGCSLRNTDRIYGSVVYAGHDTKIFKNAMKAPSKRSKIEKTVDKIILFTFSLLFAFTLSGCFVIAYWTKNEMPKHWYLAPESASSMFKPSSPGIVAAISFITSFIIYGYLIPISMYVSIEMVKVYQSIVLIGRDRSMYHKETDTPALARTSNLQEELGMVNTVLSDKTGTLTRNVMEFFKCSIAGVAYGAGITEVERANAARRGKKLAAADVSGNKFQERFFNFYDERIMGSRWKEQPHPEIIEQFFRLLAVCHTVIPDGPPDPSVLKYEAESPDEAALVVAAKVFGFFCYKRTNTTVTVREMGVDREYEILNILEFNSTRKRMSVIFRGEDGRVFLYCKGADTVIYERLDPEWKMNAEMKEVTSNHLEEFGSAGLRTLCLSYTELDPSEYERWQEDYIEAKTSLVQREEKLDAVNEKIEKKLRLLGCTAIEDKLQEGVPTCIARLAEAGIRIWVLTGDKMETAINIGYACSLLSDAMEQYKVSVPPNTMAEIERLESEAAALLSEAAASGVLRASAASAMLRGSMMKSREDMTTSKEDVLKTVAARREQATMLGVEKVATSLAHVLDLIHSAPKDLDHAMIIDGKALQYALHPKNKQAFLEVGLMCKAVICCRVSPRQKADVTALVKSHGDTTLAIGDGANDVGMIQKAHIGVGISGQEGMQAVMSADFAIAQFRFLEQLLLVHGRYSYKRITRMVLFFLYKNLYFGITIFVYNALTVFSGQLIFNDFYMSLFNVVFTSLTPLAIGAFDQDIEKNFSLKYPALYREGQRNQYFTFPVIASWFVSGFWHAAVTMVLVIVGTRPIFSDRADGTNFTHWQVGALLFSVIIITVHLAIALVIDHWTWLHFVSIVGSVLIWWAYLIAYGAFPLYFSLDLYELFLGVVAASPQYWLYLLLVPIACLLFDFFIRHTRRLMYPEYHHVVQEMYNKKRRSTGLDVEAASVSTTATPSKSKLTPLKILPRRNTNTGCVTGEAPGSPSHFSPDQNTHNVHPVTKHLSEAAPFRHRPTGSGPVPAVDIGGSPKKELTATPTSSPRRCAGDGPASFSTMTTPSNSDVFSMPITPPTGSHYGIPLVMLNNPLSELATFSNHGDLPGGVDNPGEGGSPKSRMSTSPSGRASTNSPGGRATNGTSQVH